MRPMIRTMSFALIMATLLVPVAPAAAQLDPLDPRFDIADAQLVRDTVTDALYVHIVPKQPWVAGPPLDPYSSYVEVIVEQDEAASSLAWSEFDGTTSVSGSGPGGEFTPTIYLLQDGSLLISLPITPRPGDEFWVNIETMIAPTSADAGGGSTWGRRLTLEDATSMDVLFGSNYPVLNLGSGEEVAPPVTSKTVVTTSTPVTAVVTEARPAPSAAAAPTTGTVTETGRGRFPAVPAAFVLLVMLAAFAAVMMRRRSVSRMDRQPTPDEENERTLRLFGLEGNSATLETSVTQKTPPSPPSQREDALPCDGIDYPGEDALPGDGRLPDDVAPAGSGREEDGSQKTQLEEDALLPNFRPGAGMYVPTGDLKTELQVDRECADDEKALQELGRKLEEMFGEELAKDKKKLKELRDFVERMVHHKVVERERRIKEIREEFGTPADRQPAEDEKKKGTGTGNHVGDTASPETSGEQKVPSGPQAESDPLLPNFRPTGIYILSDDLKADLAADARMEKLRSEMDEEMKDLDRNLEASIHQELAEDEKMLRELGRELERILGQKLAGDDKKPRELHNLVERMVQRKVAERDRSRTRIREKAAEDDKRREEANRNAAKDEKKPPDDDGFVEIEL
ncbi:hypothetical protein BMS3Abin02_00644 [bacterium BMS3Abin02]|nr:hypothetical protein BMS3Abin02_00644 [bacterium BMS3Abin02]